MDNQKEDITAGNRTIAEFMGAEMPCNSKDAHGNITSCSLLYNGVRVDYIGNSGYGGFKFHSSFDWLMPVVEKIEKMDYGFKMCRKVVEVYIDSTKVNILRTKESSRIESLWLAVIQFINWYNQNKTNG